jgi:hypothetical protein
MWRSRATSSPSNAPAPVTAAQPCVLLAVSARARPVAERASTGGGGGAGPAALTAPLPPLLAPPPPPPPPPPRLLATLLLNVLSANATAPLAARCGLKSAPEPPAGGSGLAGCCCCCCCCCCCFGPVPPPTPSPPPPPPAGPFSAAALPPWELPCAGAGGPSAPAGGAQLLPVPRLDAALPLALAPPPPPPSPETKPQSSARRSAAMSASASRAPLVWGFGEGVADQGRRHGGQSHGPGIARGERAAACAGCRVQGAP